MSLPSESLKHYDSGKMRRSACPRVLDRGKYDVLLTYSPQVPHDFIQGRGERVIDVQEDAFGISHLECLPDMRHDGLEFMSAGNLHNIAFQSRCSPDRREAYGDFLLGEFACGSQSFCCVSW